MKKIKFENEPKLYNEIIHDGKFIEIVDDENGYAVRKFELNGKVYFIK